MSVSYPWNQWEFTPPPCYSREKGATGRSQNVHEAPPTRETKQCCCQPLIEVRQIACEPTIIERSQLDPDLLPDQGDQHRQLEKQNKPMLGDVGAVSGGSSDPLPIWRCWSAITTSPPPMRMRRSSDGFRSSASLDGRCEQPRAWESNCVPRVSAAQPRSRSCLYTGESPPASTPRWTPSRPERGWDDALGS